MEYVYPLVVGLIAGWLASLLLGGKGGLVRCVLLGVLGAIVGGILAPKIGFQPLENLHLNNVVVATGGAVLVLLLAQILGK
jgi:uncharacterized membrane protein YeaQ/YmgE (transglycosylase-associated protein family)